MHIQHFFDKDTATLTYVVSDPATKKCAIIDSVLNYDLHSGKVTTTSADAIIAYIKEEKLTVEWILETHVHADHLTAAPYLKQKLHGKIAIGNHIKAVLKHWVPIFNTADTTPLDGSQFDHLFNDGETFYIGELSVKVIYTPGHTPACNTYVINNEVAFIGDTLFAPQRGTARADFPGANAETLYNSIQKIFNLGDNVKLYLCHDYPAENEELTFVTTVKQQKEKNIMVNQTISQVDYIKKRNIRDRTLPVPKLLLSSLQVNMRAGNLGNPENNGIRYLKIPLDKL